MSTGGAVRRPMFSDGPWAADSELAEWVAAMSGQDPPGDSGAAEGEASEDRAEGGAEESAGAGASPSSGSTSSGAGGQAPGGGGGGGGEGGGEGGSRRRSQLVVPGEEPPRNLFVYPVAEPALFPGMTMPLMVEGEHAQRIVETAASQSRFLGFLARRRPGEADEARVDTRGLYEMGVAGRILRLLTMPDGSTALLTQAVGRFHVQRWVRRAPLLIARVDYPSSTRSEDERVEALFREVRGTVSSLLELIEDVPPPFAAMVAQASDPGALCDFVAGHFPFGGADRQSLLECLDVGERLERLLSLLIRELELRKLGHRIHEELREKMEAQQKQYVLREQLKAIRRELGEQTDLREADAEQYARRIDEAELPKEAEERARQELRRLESLPSESSEYHVVRTYLDWLVELPWSRLRREALDLDRAESILERDHFGLKDIKERILEVLAVRKLRADARAPVICFVGPPGVGKTSLGQSIARALRRDFFRFSLGGMRDEAELKGHRRTYVGAMPGKILQGLKRAGSRNPVFLLDEIDKLANDGRGDPASAMLEILDPAQNHGFLDHYIDLPFDLSQVLFIATANVVEQIPPPLRDRMEVIRLAGYTEDEKTEIAARHLLPRQRDEVGLEPAQLQIPRPVLREIAAGWTREAGVRQLDRLVGRVARKAASAVARGRDFAPRVTVGRLGALLGPRHHERELVERAARPGVAVGLAWTAAGGEVLHIEAATMRGTGKVLLTGQLGDVMTESARIAFSYLRTRAEEWGIDAVRLEETDVHVHFPAGAIPKDGPSAGITIATALVSRLAPTQPLVRSRLAMTGELTLTGKVLPVGGIKEKLLAACQAGVTMVVLPEANRKDVGEIEAETLASLEVRYASRYDDVAAIAFETPLGADREAGAPS